VLTLGYDS